MTFRKMTSLHLDKENLINMMITNYLGCKVKKTPFRVCVIRINQGAGSKADYKVMVNITLKMRVILETISQIVKTARAKRFFTN
jgi:hypothetical protein